ncbi:hypothetical protein AAC387_Pa01g1088 [Persea americana]
MASKGGLKRIFLNVVDNKRKGIRLAIMMSFLLLHKMNEVMKKIAASPLLADSEGLTEMATQIEEAEGRP